MSIESEGGIGVTIIVGAEHSLADDAVESLALVRRLHFAGAFVLLFHFLLGADDDAVAVVLVDDGVASTPGEFLHINQLLRDILGQFTLKLHAILRLVEILDATFGAIRSCNEFLLLINIHDILLATGFEVFLQDCAPLTFPDRLILVLTLNV